MGRRGAYPSAPQNVCGAVKRKDIACLPARSHAFNHEAKMLACKGIFARPSMPSPCRRHGWGQSPRRLQSSIRRRQLYHEAKMCARTNIFARPSIAQPRIARKRQSRLILLFKQNPKHYTMKRKCLLARAFSRGRQLRSRAKARKRQSRLILPSAKSLRILYHIFALFQALHSYFNFLRPAPTNIRPCQPRQTALISSGSSPNYVLLFQRIVPICDYTL